MLTKHALEGIKVADFCWGASGPLTTTTLGAYGATVVMVESHSRFSPARMARPYKDNIAGLDRGGTFIGWNNSKYSITINLFNAGGREIAWKLIKWADVIAESFSPGTMKRWGLDYEQVKKVKPDIIYYSTSMQGQSGPFAGYRGWGFHASALAGMVQITGWPDRAPVPPYYAYTDFIGPRFAVASIIAALEHRRRTGEGQYIDQSQLETALQFAAPAILDYTVNGHIIKRRGNQMDYAAPHSVYRCAGEDSWCAIAVFTDLEWTAFCKVVGEPDWTKDQRFASLKDRKGNEEELNVLVEGWTIHKTAAQVMNLMQASGIATGIVASPGDLFRDPHLKHRGHFRILEHAMIGPYADSGQVAKLNKTPDSPFASPTLGQHNPYVFKEILGMSDDDIAEALINGAITTEADLPEFKTAI